MSYISPHVHKIMRFTKATGLGHSRALNGPIRSREYLIWYYKNWQEEVKALVAEKHLLVFNVKQGWEPLCRLAHTTPQCMNIMRLQSNDDFITFMWAVNRKSKATVGSGSCTCVMPLYHAA